MNFQIKIKFISAEKRILREKSFICSLKIMIRFSIIIIYKNILYKIKNEIKSNHNKIERLFIAVHFVYVSTNSKKKQI